MSTAHGPALHPALASVSGYLGVFEGDGAGDYPTIEAFRYREQVSFGHVGKPFLAYEQRTWNPDTAAPMHAERGYLRLVPEGVEFVLAHPTGIVEVQQGPPVVEGTMACTSTVVEGTATAEEVRHVRRRFQLEGDVLTVDLWMTTPEVPDGAHHLRSVLHRQV
ncbi:MAG: FABP family protein [Nitriliruptoraceae bacterium]|nr:FABP family protein [Nitriliruptoraceae bacterium]